MTRSSSSAGLRTAVLNCDHTDPVHCVQFNPKYVMLVAACWTIWATTWPATYPVFPKWPAPQATLDRHTTPPSHNTTGEARRWLCASTTGEHERWLKDALR
ncbi:hypothetical protein HPB47_013700 [Ixodes persulcatus]|uniref:Uncharacterized protein n=1 Tax=Ixodes persulcatus TaxID=34615 RepID=A0AC60QYS0_IXOPE|nr:hypothetical protein HPB47_013700 [Ixodes persulcatus]